MITGLFRKILIGFSSLCVVSTGTVGAIASLEASGQIDLTSDQVRQYQVEWFNDGVKMCSHVYNRGETISYDGETPTRINYEDNTEINVFSGWDYTGDNIPDIPVLNAYMNLKQNACFSKITDDLLEKIDWQKLLEYLMDKNIDLESILTKLGLSPEEIARLLKLTAFRVKTSQTGPAYFRTESFGDYNKKKEFWVDAAYYDLSKISPSSINPLQYSANAVSKLASHPLLASYGLLSNYEIEYVKTGGKFPTIAFETSNDQNIPSDSYSVRSVSDNNIYSTTGFPFIPCTEETVLAILGSSIGTGTAFTNDAIAADERVYRNYVRDNYLNVDEDYRNYFNALNNNVIHADKNNVGLAVKQITEYFTKNFKFNMSHNDFPKSSDSLKYFLDTAKEGDTNYFATATTLLLRTLGYPARYTQGYMGVISDPNGWNDVSSLQAYSWAEVYVDGIGWMSADTAMYLLAGQYKELGVIPYDSDILDMDDKGKNKTLVRLETGDKTKKEVIAGHDYNYEDDLELYAVFSDGVNESKELVKPTSTLPIDTKSILKGPYDKTAFVYYTYLDKTKYISYNVHVLPLKLEELIIKNDKYYYTNTEILIKDFEISGLFNNGETYDSSYFDLSNLTCTGIPPVDREVGTYEINFTYFDQWDIDGINGTYKYKKFNLTVYEKPTVVSVEPLEPLPDLFYIGNEVNLSTYVFKITYNNGVVDNNYHLRSEDIIDPQHILSLTGAPGNYEVTIKVGDSCEPYIYHFEVKENLLEYIYLNNGNLRTTYFINREDDSIDKVHDLTVIAHYSDGSEKGIDQSSDNFKVLVDDFLIEGEKEVTVKYKEHFKYAGDIEKEVTYNINVIHLVNLSFKLLTGDLYIKVDTESISEELKNSILYLATYNNKYYEYVSLDNENLKIYFQNSDVNLEMCGVYNVPVEFDYSDFKDPATDILKVRVYGLDHVVGSFKNKPATIYSLHTYDIYNWEPCLTTYITEDGENYDIKTINFGEDERYVLTITNPIFYDGSDSVFIFDEAGECTVTMKYTYEQVEREWSEIYTVTERKPLEGTFDVSGIDEKIIRDTEDIEVYYNTINASIMFNDGIEDSFYYSNKQISVIDEAQPIVDGIEVHNAKAVIEINDVTFTKEFSYKIEYPTSIKVNENKVKTRYDINVSAETLDFSVVNADLIYKDFKSVTIANKDLTIALKEERKLGMNTVEVKYTYGDFKEPFIDKFEIEFYKTTLNITPVDEKHVVCEGDSFFVFGLYNTTLSYEVGEGCEEIEDKTITTNDGVGFDKAYFEKVKSGETSFKAFYSSEPGLQLQQQYKIDVYAFDSLEIDDKAFKESHPHIFRLDEFKTIDYQLLSFSAVFKSTLDETKIFKRKLSYSDVTRNSSFVTTSLGDKKINFSYRIGTNLKSVDYNYKVVEPKATGLSITLGEKVSLDYYQLLNGGLDRQISLSNSTYSVVFENGKTQTLTIGKKVEFFTLKETSNPFKNYEGKEIPAGVYVETYELEHTYNEPSSEDPSGYISKTQNIEANEQTTISYTIHKHVITDLIIENVFTTFYKNYNGTGRDEEFNDDNVTIYASTELPESVKLTGSYYSKNGVFNYNYIKLEKLNEQVEIVEPEFKGVLGNYKYTVSVKDDYLKDTKQKVTKTIDIKFIEDEFDSVVVKYIDMPYHSVSSEVRHNEITLAKNTKFNPDSLYADAYRKSYSDPDRNITAADSYRFNAAYFLDCDFDSLDFSKPGIYTINPSFSLNEKELHGEYKFTIVEANDENIYNIYLNDSKINKNTNTATFNIDEQEELIDFYNNFKIYGRNDFSSKIELDRTDCRITNYSGFDINNIKAGSYYIYVYYEYTTTDGEYRSINTYFKINIVDELRIDESRISFGSNKGSSFALNEQVDNKDILNVCCVYVYFNDTSIGFVDNSGTTNSYIPLHVGDSYEFIYSCTTNGVETKYKYVVSCSKIVMDPSTEYQIDTSKTTENGNTRYYRILAKIKFVRYELDEDNNVISSAQPVGNDSKVYTINCSYSVK